MRTDEKASVYAVRTNAKDSDKRFRSFYYGCLTAKGQFFMVLAEEMTNK